MCEYYKSLLEYKSNINMFELYKSVKYYKYKSNKLANQNVKTIGIVIKSNPKGQPNQHPTLEINIIKQKEPPISANIRDSPDWLHNPDVQPPQPLQPLSVLLNLIPTLPTRPLQHFKGTILIIDRFSRYTRNNIISFRFLRLFICTCYCKRLLFLDRFFCVFCRHRFMDPLRGFSCRLL